MTQGMGQSPDYERLRLMVRAARLYYEEDRSQEEVSRALGLSRSYVSKLLSGARQAGIVQIRVVDPLDMESALERRLTERFGLERTIVLPQQPGEDPQRQLGEAAARYLNGILRDGDTIGTSWGDTMYRVSQSLAPRPDLRDLRYVQLCGGVSDIHMAVYASEIASGYSGALGCSAQLIQLPAIVSSPALKAMLEGDESVARAFRYWREARILLFTVGAFGAQNALVRVGYLHRGHMDALLRRGAVGDICTHVIDGEGRLCDPELDARTIAIPLEEMKKKRYRVCVAQGADRVDSMLGALRGGIANVLITNETTAQRLLERIDRQPDERR